jgi:hypothetical protein
MVFCVGAAITCYRVLYICERCEKESLWVQSDIKTYFIENNWKTLWWLKCFIIAEGSEPLKMHKSESEVSCSTLD